MIENYKQYNNLPQKDKESAIAKAAENSNTNENTLIANTDEVESLLRTVISKLETLNANTDTIEAKLDSIDGHVDDVETKLNTIESDLTTINSSVQGTTNEVASQGQAIVQAIQGQ